MGCKWLIKETGYTPPYPIIIRPSALRDFYPFQMGFLYLCGGEMQKGPETRIYSMYGGISGQGTHGWVGFIIVAFQGIPNVRIFRATSSGMQSPRSFSLLLAGLALP